MAFCVNCGAQLVDGAKFCQKCGISVSVSQKRNQCDERQQEFAGKIYKCPNCGEILKSFETNCPTCGFELRSIKATSAVREFALKLEAIEARRERKPYKGLFKKEVVDQELSKTDEQKISLIKNFSIPNTKEDILEFMILATSNINPDAYGTFNPIKANEKALTYAWYSKIKQVYAKAKNSYVADPDFLKIQELYDTCVSDINKTKRKDRIKYGLLYGLLFGWMPLLIIIAILVTIIKDPANEKREIERLNAIVVDVQNAIESGEYKQALRIAETINYQRSDSEMKRKWGLEKANWIDKVLETAKHAGVELEYNSNEDEKNTINTDKDTDSVLGAFAQGFNEGLGDSADTIKENMAQFNEILNSSNQVEKETTMTSADESNISITIKKDSVYSYGKDEYTLYVATAITDNIIKIEKWGKHLSSSQTVSYNYDVGTFKINDKDNGFSWVDDDCLAFSFSLADDKEGFIKKANRVTFVLSNSDGNTNKGSYLKKGDDYYIYEDNDWTIYKAIPLTDNIIKIESWYRSMSIGRYHYSCDVDIVDISKDDTDFEWVDDGRQEFTITLTDGENKDLKHGKFVTFIKNK